MMLETDKEDAYKDLTSQFLEDGSGRMSGGLVISLRFAL